MGGGGSTNPSGVGAANPNSVLAGAQTLLTVTVTPGTNPTSTGLAVSANLSAIGGSSVQNFFDNGTNGDAVAGDNIFSFLATVAPGTTAGTKNLPATISDDQLRTGSATITLSVAASTPPSGVGSATPNPVTAGGSTLLKVTVTPGSNPTSTGLGVTADLSLIGGSSSQQFFDNGTNGDVTAGDNVFSFNATVPAATSTGTKSLPFSVSDAQSRTGSGTISLTVQSAPVPPGAVVISQVYGGGGNAGATLKNDFIELFNRSASTVSLAGWSVQRASSSGNGWSRTPLTGSIQPGQYYLVQEAAGAGGTVNLPTPDATGTIALSLSANVVALINNNTTLPDGCPSGPNLIDLLGQGTGTVCFDTAVGPTLGNTTAAFRTHNGCKDTDNNSLDFKVGSPSPRNSSSPLSICPVGDLEPEIFNTTPGDSALSVPVDSPITIQFDEPVDVVGAWFNISCANSGIHTATVSGGPAIFTLTPTTPFGQLEQCTVTVFASQVTDQDNIDPPDNMAANGVFSFLTAHDGAEHMLFGNPSGATADPINFFENYLMTKPQYALSYNGTRGTPNWTSWHLDQTWLGSAPRQDDFRNDTTLPPNFYQVLGTDYSGSGFDRGHQTPSADRTSSIPDNSATFLMTNMTPQAPDNNQGPWEDFESYLRTLVSQGNEIYIIAGPAGTGGIGSNGPATTIANGHVTVPAKSWKVALILPVGENDLSRVDANTRTLAVIVPNIQGIKPDLWQKYLATVDQVEALTGYDFFSNVPVSIQNVIEARLDAQNDTAPVADNQSVFATEDIPLAVTLTASDFNINNQFIYTITNGPSHGVLSGTGANLMYTPAADYFGPDTFTFKVNDGALDSNEATITISVSEVNDSPTAVADSKTMDWNSTLSFPSSDLTANDSAGPNEGDQSLTVTAVAGSTHGSVSLSAGTVSYTPNNNFFGTDTFSYTVCDNGTTNGNADPKCTTGTVNVTVNLVDITPPVVTVPGDLTREATGPNGAAVTFTVSATDNVDGPVPTTCDHNSGDVFPLGTTAVSCFATDAHNNTGTASFNVIVVDTTAPSITVPSNITTEATSPAGATVTFTVAAIDTVDGSVAVNCDHASGSVFALGTTTVNCSATDAHNNSNSSSFTVTVEDTTPPTIAVPANITVEATGASGAAVSFSVSATDIVDGSVAVNCDHTSGSVFALGTTTVNCSASDAHNNSSSKSFTVTVQDTTAPTITVPANITVEATGPSGAAVSFSVSATDIVDGSVAVNCDHASGGVFALGTTTVNCSATDAHNNSASRSFTVTVRDTAAPTVTVPANITVEATGPNGATVNFTVTASDPVSGALTPTCNHPSGSVFALGTTTVTCSATDGSNNTGSAGFTVTVRDTTRPVLTLPANITVQATSAAGAVVTFVATAQDTVNGALPVTCIPASGSTFPIGTTVVNCNATDGSNNTATGSFTVTVTSMSPRQIKQQLLADMNALLATITNNVDKKKLSKAIDDLEDSLNPSYWVDDNHLQPKKGQKVFNNEQDSVDVLADLIKNKKSIIPDAILQGFIDREVAADRALALTEINEATAAHGDSHKLAQARADFQDGDDYNAAGKYEKAIGQYREAWKEALKSRNIDCD